MKSIAQVCFARVAGCRLFCRPEELPLKNGHFAFLERRPIKGIVYLSDDLLGFPSDGESSTVTVPASVGFAVRGSRATSPDCRTLI